MKNLAFIIPVIIGIYILFLPARDFERSKTDGIDTLKALRAQLIKRNLMQEGFDNNSDFTESLLNDAIVHDTIPASNQTIFLDTLTDQKLLEGYDRVLKAMYGVDNREDVSCRGITNRSSFLSSNDRYIVSARTVCALIPKRMMTKRPDGYYQVEAPTLLETKFKEVKPCSTTADVCFNNEIFNENIRYASQKVGACCTGFGYQSNKVVTAYHCFENGKGISDFYFVFGYCYLPGEPAYNLIPQRDVYEARSIAIESTLRDFVIIELNRSLRQWQKASLDTSPMTDYQSVYMAGHPDGLPLKLTLDAKAVPTEEAAPEFSTNLDAFHGNSGSPVFNRTGKVVGILLKGDKDYEKIVSGCARYYKSTSSYGEAVLKAAFIH